MGCHFLLQGSSWPRDRTQVSRIAGRHFTIWATREVLSCFTSMFCYLKTFFLFIFLASQVILHEEDRAKSGRWICPNFSFLFPEFKFSIFFQHKLKLGWKRRQNVVQLRLHTRTRKQSTSLLLGSHLSVWFFLRISCCSHAFRETNSLRRTVQIVECSLLHGGPKAESPLSQGPRPASVKIFYTPCVHVWTHHSKFLETYVNQRKYDPNNLIIHLLCAHVLKQSNN